MNDWLLLTATLPTSPSALRVRIWRSLKATGAGALRDGVYLLPSTAATAQALWSIERAIQDGGADAHMLVVQARDDAQEGTFRGLFDRSEAYAEWLQSLKEARSRITRSTEPELRKSLRAMEQQLQNIQASDFFPGKQSMKADAAFAAFRHEVEQHLSPGEPSTRGEAIQRQALSAFKGKTWATRKRPWVDRLATAWLVRRFVDSKAAFLWLDSPKKCPKSAVGFDFDGATFTHVGDKVTCEVVMHTFSLEGDTALKRLAELVHYIDVGGIPVDAGPGVEAIVRGLLALHESDDALLKAALPVFDSLYASLRTVP